MDELLKYFDWTSLIMASVATSCALSVFNQTKRGQEIHNAVIALFLSVFFSVLLTEWTGFVYSWQPITFRFCITILVSCLFAVSKGQGFVDSFLGFMLDKINVKKPE